MNKILSFKFPIILFCFVACFFFCSQIFKHPPGKKNLDYLPGSEFIGNGGCEDSYSEYINNKVGIPARITYCEEGDASRERVLLQVKVVESTININVVGYFSDKVKFSIVDDNQKLIKGQPDLPAKDPGEIWTLLPIEVPEEYVGRTLFFELQDDGEGIREWAGMSLPVEPDSGNNYLSQLITVLGLLLLCLLAASVNNICLTLSVKFARREAESLVLSFVFMLCLYYSIFWLFFIWNNLGKIVSIIFILYFVFKFFHSFFDKSSSAKNIRELSKYFYIVVLYSLSIFLFVFSFSDLSEIQQGSASAFTHALPIDNFLPKIFSDQIYSAALQSPMVGDWLSSDRPPLQTGMFLLYYAAADGQDYAYQFLSMILQAYILMPALMIIKRIFLSNSLLGLLSFFSFSTSSLILIHTIYVWPKLISAACLLFVIYFYFHKTLFSENKYLRTFVLSSLASLSLLSHTGSVFALFPIAVGCLLIFKPSVKEQLFAVLVLSFMMAPWLLYQKVIDPPGNRLAKWHLAGEISVNNTSLTSAIASAYSTKSYEEIYNDKLFNFKTLFRGVFNSDNYLKYTDLHNLNEFKNRIEVIRTNNFFGYFYSMIPFVFIALVAVPFLYKNYMKVGRSVFTLLYVSITAVIIWCCLMFERGSTVIHQGPYISWVGIYLFSLIAIGLSFRSVAVFFNYLYLVIAFIVYIASNLLFKPLTNSLLLLVFLLSVSFFVSLSLNKYKVMPYEE